MTQNEITCSKCGSIRLKNKGLRKGKRSRQYQCKECFSYFEVKIKEVSRTQLGKKLTFSRDLSRYLHFFLADNFSNSNILKTLQLSQTGWIDFLNRSSKEYKKDWFDKGGTHLYLDFKIKKGVKFRVMFYLDHNDYITSLQLADERFVLYYTETEFEDYLKDHNFWHRIKTSNKIETALIALQAYAHFYNYRLKALKEGYFGDYDEDH